MMVFTVALPPMAKARPRVTGRGTYMPSDYVQWKADFGRLCCATPPLEPGPFGCRVVFVTKAGKMRPDLDNALGAVLDALQDAGVIANDRQAVQLETSVVRGSEWPAIEIALWRVT